MSSHRTSALRSTYILGIACLLGLGITTPSNAQSGCSDGAPPAPHPVSGVYVCSDGSPPSSGTPAPSPSPGTPTSQPGQDAPSPAPGPFVLVRNWETNDDGTTCTLWTREELNGRSEAEVTTLFNTRWFLRYERLWVEGNHSDRCPGSEDGEDVPTITGDQVWAVFEGQLDRPEPQIVPGRMLTGLTSYLETGRPLEHTNAIDMLGLTLEVRATATFMVDWGDGTVTGPHDTPGDPYPDGTVTHIYTDKGTYDVQVTDTWTMEWRFRGGTWSAPSTTQMEPVMLEGFVVREYRAVRVTPDS